MSRFHHIRAAQAQQHRDPRGEVTSFLATAAETDGRVAIFDSVLEKGRGAPWHYHEIDDEIFYIVRGQVEFGVANETLVANPGDLVIVGPHVGRRFTALEDSQFITINAPAGPAEGFLRELMNLDGPPTQEDRQRFAKRYKIHLGRPAPSPDTGGKTEPS